MKRNPEEMVVVMAFTPKWKEWRTVSDPVTRTSAAPLIEAQWKAKRLARLTPVEKAVAA
jgi:hypothetical protein